MYGIAEIPAQIVPSDIAIICFGAFLLCTLAALPPAYMVARLDPAKALRD
jgi:lipoprotein-releasing system permease protein